MPSYLINISNYKHHTMWQHNTYCRIDNIAFKCFILNQYIKQPNKGMVI